jgi:iodotyrosine deiodinase
MARGRVAARHQGRQAVPRDRALADRRLRAAARRPDPDNPKQNYYVTESVGLACGLLLATLHQAGVATLVHTPNPMRFLNRICRRPDNEKPVMIIIAGHPGADATIPVNIAGKKPLEEISSWL